MALGVALAQAERGRRAAKAQRKRALRFARLPGEPLHEALRRMALGQLDLAIELLAGEPAGGRAFDPRAIHNTRKALKRLRALVRLLRAELGEQRYKREHAILRDAARRLAGARDAEVMVATLDALLERHPRKLGRRPELLDLRERLVAERAAAELATLGDRATREEVLCELHGLRERARRWNLPERPGIALVERDLRRIYRDGRLRKRRVARERGAGGTRGKHGGGARAKGDGGTRGKRGGGARGTGAGGARGERGGSAREAHAWRKRVKDLRYAAEILGARSLARRADRLAELLGEEHDLVVLAGLLPPPGGAPFKGRRGKRARKALLVRIARRRRRLRRRALREGERVYGRKPKQFVRRTRRAHKRR
ncbi:MAG: CHAD domain-containing protein [Solirubrobacteraceae bacterium]